eukprot:14766692-Alexandrium_andersonii.AAC.1
MSASLVGSEMCIRDSLGGVATSFPDVWRGLARSATPSPSTLEARRHPIPVSYTHLTLPTICSV